LTRSFGISGGGRSAEQLFRDLTGAEPASSASIGDALLEGYPVEIKRATANTLNQVRAVKYIPIVAYHEPSGSWYVIPAHVVVAQVSQKRRGQHTENPFESATLSLGNLAAFRLDEPDQLRARTLAAIESAAGFPALKSEMERVLEESKLLAETSVERVRTAVEAAGITMTGRRPRSAKRAGRALRELLDRQ
jgi:hypothetical protein